MRRIPDKSIDLVITDPPYGVLPNGKGNDKFTWDNIKLEKFTQEWFSILKIKIKLDTFIYIFWSQKHLNLGFKILNPHRLLIMKT